MTRRALIIIPNRATFVAAWALEEAVRISGDFDVYLADLAKFESRYRGILGKFYWALDNVLESNNIRKLLKTFCDSYDIHLVPFSKFSAVKPRSLSSNEDELFERALRSNYSKHFGSGSIKYSDINQNLVMREKYMFQKALTSIEKIVYDLSPDYLITINGRGFVDSCVVATAKKMKLNYGLIELSGESWGYYSVHRTTTHSPYEVQEKINMVWERDSGRYTAEELKEIARNYFESRFSPENEWRALQRDNSTAGKPRDYVVFFPTSDHEFATFPELIENKTDFLSQVDAFVETAKICRKLNLDLYVRVHPHQADSVLAVSEDSLWKDLCNKYDAICILSASGENSFELAKNAHASVTHISTIGAELAWLGIPIAFTTHSTYSNLISDSSCFTRARLESFLSAPSNTNQKENLLKWAFYMSRGEYPTKIFQINSFSDLELGEVRLNEVRRFPQRIVRAIAKLKFLRREVFVGKVPMKRNNGEV